MLSRESFKSDEDYASYLRDYFMAHAPVEPQQWFRPLMKSERPEPVMGDANMSSPEWDQFPKNSDDISAWDEERKKQLYIQWPAAWADEMLKQRSKP
jgi:hypothetical protein